MADASDSNPALEHDASDRARAVQANPEREIDWFLPVVGLLGLGLVASLVYIYW